MPLACSGQEAPDITIESPTIDKSPEALHDHPWITIPASDKDQVN